MKILSHRGYWKSPQEKNSEVAFERSFKHGYGTETDVRDRDGRLVISHDMANAMSMPIERLLAMLDGKPLTLALNIKADGLAEPIAECMRGRSLDWFVFDMSVPDMRQHIRVGNPVFARMSEVEMHPAWIDEVRGIWLDSFDDTWYGVGLVRNLLNRGLKVCVVSPELHGRPPQGLWSELLGLREADGLMLCTDLPEEADLFFNTL